MLKVSIARLKKLAFVPAGLLIAGDAVDCSCARAELQLTMAPALWQD